MKVPLRVAIPGHSFSPVAERLYDILQEAIEILMRQKKLDTQKLKLIPHDSIIERKKQKTDGRDANSRNEEAVKHARKLFLDELELDRLSLQMFNLFEGDKLLKQKERSIAAKERSIVAKTRQIEAQKRQIEAVFPCGNKKRRS
jgi:hypothetical protein